MADHQAVMHFDTRSSAETIEVGRKLAKLLEPPKFLILRGDLGTGKTTLVKGIAEALDAADADEVTSPTFTIIHEYEGTREVHTILQGEYALGYREDRPVKRSLPPYQPD